MVARPKVPANLPMLRMVVSVAVAAAICAGATAQVSVSAHECTAIRGEPMLLEVRVGSDATIPPIDVVSPAGVRLPVVGRLVWPYVPAPAGGSLTRWAVASNPLRVVDERPVGAGSAYLVVDIPPDVDDRAQLAVGATTVPLRACDAAPAELLATLAARASMITPQGERDPLVSLPDPAAPFERFRFELGVAMRAWPEPPAFRDGSGDDLVARAHTAMWNAALARILASAAGPAIELAELLVATCADETAPAPIAAWIAHPDELRTLLRLALDREFTGARLASSINEFMRVRSPVVGWVEDSDRSTVTLAFANPSTRAQVVKYQWVAGTDTDVLPLVLDVPPAEVRRARVERPAPAARRGYSTDAPGAVEQLHVQCGAFATNVVVPPATLSVTPRGIEVAELLAPLNLLTVSTGARTGALVVPGARVALRERLAGWEIYTELPAGAVDDAITVFGPTGGSVRVGAGATVSMQGCELAADAVEFGDVAGTARASFFVPPSWIEREELGTLVEVGFRRAFDAGFADAPFASVPWRKSPRTVAIDLSAR